MQISSPLCCIPFCPCALEVAALSLLGAAWKIKFAVPGLLGTTFSFEISECLGEHKSLRHFAPFRFTPVRSTSLLRACSALPARSKSLLHICSAPPFHSKLLSVSMNADLCFAAFLCVPVRSKSLLRACSALPARLKSLLHICSALPFNSKLLHVSMNVNLCFTSQHSSLHRAWTCTGTH